MAATNVAIPADAERIAAEGRVIMPGIVDTHSHIGQVAGADGSGPIQPEVRAMDSIDPLSSNIAKARAAGRHVILIDDVYASGATLRAAARVLARSGALKISALTWARVVPDALMTGNIFDFATLDSDMMREQQTG